MNALAYALVLLLAGAGPPAWEALAQLRGQESQLVQKRTDLAAQLEAKARAVDAAKARANGPVEESRLRETMAQAQELAQRLLDADRRLEQLRREMLTAADRAAGEVRDPALRAQAVQVRVDVAKALTAPPASGRSIQSALGVTESATDGAEDLREKADLLADTEEKIRRELATMDKRYVAAQRRSELQRSMRSLDDNVFMEDTRRQRASGTTGGDSAGSPTHGPTQTGGSGGGSGGDPAPGNNLTGPTTTTSTGSQPADVILLTGILDATTLGELSRPQDSAHYVKALERARDRLRSLALDLDQRSQALRKRADELRKK
jgi:hypothetical protein